MSYRIELEALHYRSNEQGGWYEDFFNEVWETASNNDIINYEDVISDLTEQQCRIFLSLWHQEYKYADKTNEGE